MFTLTLMIGLVSTALCCMLAFALPQRYNVSDALRHTAILMAFLLPGKLSMLAAVAVMYALQSLRVIPGLITLKRGRWVRNITEGDAA
ncbi:MAG: hypothetical protein LLF96_11080 [Eubacteriales bacterium]|nr:hypothetical protein [Eubacteriales bacterium]